MAQSRLPVVFSPDNAHGCNESGAAVGVALGALAGLVIGNQFRDRRTGRVVGALVGGVIGGTIGHEVDRRSCELKKIAAQNRLKLELNRIEAPAPAADPSEPARSAQAIGLSVAVQETPEQFASGSDVLTPEARAYFAEIADTYAYRTQLATLPQDASDEERAAIESLKSKVILLVGHTDDVGPTEANAALSERRARTMAQLFYERGVPIAQVYYQGAGETLPVGDNRTEAGRARNRRVEIIDLPDVAALTTYLNAREPRVEHFRPAISNEPDLTAQILPTEEPAQPRPQPIHRTSRLARSSPGRMVPPAVQPKPPIVATTSEEWDFGGHSASEAASPNIGKQIRSGFIIGSRAEAGEFGPSKLPACAADRPRVAYAVRSLETGAELPFSTADYIPGLYGASWSGVISGQLVALTNVSVLKDGGRAAIRPELLLYRDYTADPDPRRRPNVRTRPHVNVYRGQKAILYRVFAIGTANVTCIDMLLPPGGGFAAPGSHLFYKRADQRLVADYDPEVRR